MLIMFFLVSGDKYIGLSLKTSSYVIPPNDIKDKSDDEPDEDPPDEDPDKPDMTSTSGKTGREGVGMNSRGGGDTEHGN